MALRYERGAAKLLGLWSLMCALGQDYREEDIRRKGQDWRSWLDPETAIAHKPWLHAKILLPKRRGKR